MAGLNENELARRLENQSPVDFFIGDCVEREVLLHKSHPRLHVLPSDICSNIASKYT
jgi:hypothetical protein